LSLFFGHEGEADIPNICPEIPKNKLMELGKKNMQAQFANSQFNGFNAILLQKVKKLHFENKVNKKVIFMHATCEQHEIVVTVIHVATVDLANILYLWYHFSYWVKLLSRVQM
jgi:hypothetical protein